MINVTISMHGSCVRLSHFIIKFEFEFEKLVLANYKSVLIFTAQCTLVHLRGLGIACRLSVCLGRW